VTGFGIELRGTGANLMGRCPFHDDRTPSLSSRRQPTCGTAWACNVGGSVIDWVMRTRGVSFRHAVELLKADHPSLAALVERPVCERHQRSSIRRCAGRRRSQKLRQVVAFYHETLKESPEALRYLESRGLTHPEMIDHFKLGFANRTLGYAAGEEPQGRSGDARAFGTLGSAARPRGTSTSTARSCFRSSRSWRRARHVRAQDHAGICARARRCICTCRGRTAACGTKRRSSASKEIILCESIIDALTFWCAGFRNVTASYGVNGFTDDHQSRVEKARHAQRLDRLRPRRSRRRAAERLERTARRWASVHRVLFPRGMDANEYALKVTPAAQSLAVLLGNNRPKRRRKPEKVIAEPVADLADQRRLKKKRMRRFLL
jgi:DNA primase